jgi:uncharacterized protein
MKQLVEDIAKALVDIPEAVSVRVVEGEHVTVFELKVAPRDLGKVIGRQGRTARAIRTILIAAGLKRKRRFTLSCWKLLTCKSGNTNSPQSFSNFFIDFRQRLMTNLGSHKASFVRCSTRPNRRWMNTSSAASPGSGPTEWKNICPFARNVWTGSWRKSSLPRRCAQKRH